MNCYIVETDKKTDSEGVCAGQSVKGLRRKAGWLEKKQPAALFEMHCLMRQCTFLFYEEAA